MFLFHYGKRRKIGRNRGTSTLPINVLKRGPITYYSINFDQHQNFYDFFSSGVVDVFLVSVYETYRPLKKISFKGTLKLLINKGEKLF